MQLHMIQFEAILRGQIFIPHQSSGGLGTTGACLYFMWEQTWCTHWGSSREIAWRELSGCRVFLFEIAILLLLINPPCKCTLKEGWSFIHQCLLLKAAPLSLSVPTDALCFPGDSILSRNHFQSSVGLRCRNGFGCFHTASSWKITKHAAKLGKTNRILYSLFICAAFHPICHHFIPPAAEKDSVAERCLQGVVGMLILQVNINICFE